VLAVPVLLVIAACGSTATSNTSSKSASGTPFVIGNIETLTGPLVPGVLLPGIDAWESWTNAHGGINGHPVKVITMDDGGSPATSLTDVQKMVTQDHVVVILDNTDQDGSWASYIASQKIPVLNSLLNPGQNADFFDAGAPLVPTGNYGALEAAKQAGSTSLAFMYCTEVAACSQAVPTIKTLTKQLGLKLGYATGISSSAPNYTAQCLAAKAAGANALDVYSAVQAQLNVATSCAAAGWSFKLLTSDFSISNLWLKYKAANNTVAQIPVFPWVDDSTAATKAFHEAMNRYEQSTVGSDQFGEASATAWTAGQEIVSAAELGKAGVNGSAPTSREILNGLFAMHGDTLGGLAPPLTYSHQANEASTITCFFVMGITNGKFVEPDGLRTTCIK